ncbi:MAG TPA: aa3-type cytochrome c oxidase subunit IV [Sphingobium sp.]|nr:aa3-type cytochrome c oxidase subunit IV [Sphingobium sp.]
MVHDEDIVAARNTFSGFVTMIKWGTIVSIIGVAIVILLIS